MALYEDDDVIEISSSDNESLVPEEPRKEDGLQLLRKFITVCKPLLKSNQQRSISKLLTDKFNLAKESYTQSEDFRCFMREHISHLQAKQKSVYVHIQDVKMALMRASRPRRVQLTKVERIEGAKPKEETKKREPDDVVKNGKDEAETDLKVIVQDKVEEQVDKREDETVAKNLREETDAELTLREEDPKVERMEDSKPKSVYVHIQGVKTALMRVSSPRRVQLTKVERVEDAKPEEEIEKGKPDDVVKNGEDEAETDLKLVVQDKIEEQVDKREDEKVAKNLKEERDAELTLKEEDPKVERVEDAKPMEVTEKGEPDVVKNRKDEAETDLKLVVQDKIEEQVDKREDEKVAKNLREERDAELTLKEEDPKVERVEDAKPMEVTEKGEPDVVVKNRKDEAETDLKLVVQDKIEEQVDKREDEKVAKKLIQETDAKLTLEEEDPQEDGDVAKKDAETTEVDPVVEKEVSQSEDQQENKDITKNGQNNEIEVKPVNVDDNEKREDLQGDEDDVKKGKPEEPEEEITQATDSQSESLLMICETASSDNALEENAPSEEKMKEPENPDLDAVTDPSVVSPKDDSIKTPDVAASPPQVPETQNSSGRSKDEDKSKGSQKQIQKLEKLLRRLDKAIKKLQERELTLDEMDEADSAHIQEYQLRRRFVKVYNMLCKLNKSSSSTGRVIEQRIKYEGTRFPEINKRLEKLVNKKDFFPDFHDIYTAISKTNKKKGLRLDMRHVQSIAEEAFEDLGRKLQQRRQMDFCINFSSHSTLDFNTARDSTDKDPELKQKLMENRTLARQNLQKVKDSFVTKQEECEKKGENLEASEYSDSDAPSDQPSEDEDEEAEPASKKPRLDPDRNLSRNEENRDKDDADENSTDGRQFENNDQHVTDIKDEYRPTSHQTSAPKVNTNLHQRNVCEEAFSSRFLNTNKPSADAQTTSATTWNDRNQLSFDTPEQAVKSLKFDQPPAPSPSLPLVITNVCSLSDSAGFFPGPGKDWDASKATIAKVVDDGSGGILIGPPSQQRIIVKSGKRVKLQTSTPITLSFENEETKLVMQQPTQGASVPIPSPPPSVTSTQPELNASPDVEEVVEIDSPPVCQTGKWLEITTTTQSNNRRATQSLIHTTPIKQRVVSTSSSQFSSRYVRCNHCMKTCKETDWGNHSCIKSARISNSNVQSYPPKPKPRTSSFLRMGNFSTTNTSPTPHSAQNKVFNLKNTNNFPQIKTSPKWQPSPRRMNLPIKVETQGKARPRQLIGTKPVTVTTVDDEDSDVLVISDSDEDTGDKSGNRPESPDVICISDSD